MPVIRVDKNKNYTVMSNKHLKDKSLSLKAKGLLSLMLSLPENWNYSINGIISICKESETTIKSTLEELKKQDYLVVTKERDDKGHFIYVYNIYENRINKSVKIDKSPGGDFPPLDNPPVENIGQLNTNNKKTKNKEKLNKKKSTPKAYNNYEQRTYENLNNLYANT